MNLNELKKNHVKRNYSERIPGVISKANPWRIPRDYRHSCYDLNVALGRLPRRLQKETLIDFFEKGIAVPRFPYSSSQSINNLQVNHMIFFCVYAYSRLTKLRDKANCASIFSCEQIKHTITYKMNYWKTYATCNNS